MRLKAADLKKSINRTKNDWLSELTKRNGFTLAEMIMAVAMLAFFSVFIVQMFVKADQISNQTICLDQAVLTASDWADEWKNVSADEMTSEISSLVELKEDGAWIESFLDASFDVCAPDDAVYIAILSIHSADTMFDDLDDLIWTLSIKIYHGPDADHALLYELDVTRYFPEGG